MHMNDESTADDDDDDNDATRSASFTASVASIFSIDQVIH